MSHVTTVTTDTPIETGPLPAGSAETDPGPVPDRFRSILFGPSAAPAGLDDEPEPDCFSDLNLDRIVAAVVGPKESYRLSGYFHLPLDDPDLIEYRQEVFHDLECASIHELVTRFATGMQRVRARIERARKSYFRYQRQRWFLEAARMYCAAVQTIRTDLGASSPSSRGLRGFATYLDGYLASEGFRGLRDDADEVVHGLDAIAYDVWIHGSKVTVGAFDEEVDYSAQVTATFERFQQRDIEVRAPVRHTQPASAARPSVPRTADWNMDRVEGQILDQVARVFPAQFAALDGFWTAHAEFLDRLVTDFDRELQFYVAYLDHIAPLRRAGLVFGYPRMSMQDKSENAIDTFDLALAAALVGTDGGRTPVVCNDIRLSGTERILVVSGPNNGGKTTLARTVGQLHYLAKLGLPVPGRDVRLFLVDHIYTHFEREEDITTLAGKLQEELNRLHEDFQRASGRSLIVMNEMFESTTVQDALFLSKEILGRVSALDAIGVCVTFLDELADLDEKTVSMVSTVDPHDPARRTYRLVRRPADGKAYAHALAEKYGLTYEVLRRRMSS